MLTGRLDAGSADRYLPELVYGATTASYDVRDAGSANPRPSVASSGIED